MKKNNIFFRCFFSFIICFFSSCNLSRLNGGYVAVRDDFLKDGNDTFSLEVLQKINDGDKIYIFGVIKSFVNIPVKDIVINLKLLDKNSKIVDEHAYVLSKLIKKDSSEFFKEGEEKKFLISTQIKNAIDFQLELLWGDEALKKQANPVSVSSVKNIEEYEKKSEVLRMSNLYFDKKIVSPLGKNLQYYFVISGEFENLSDKVIKDISIGVSFKNKIKNDKMAGDEEFLEIKDVSLMPKSKKKFEMELETIFSGSDVNLYKPDIRIVEFSN